MYKIEIYKDKNGRSEVEEYIKSLQKMKSKDGKIKSNKVIAYIRLLQEFGLNLGAKYIKHLNKEIWKLRPLRDRILFAYLDNNIFILLSHFMKQTKKTPYKEIVKIGGSNMTEKFKSWEEFEKELNITPEQEAEIQLEMDLIRATIEARKKSELSQKELSEKTGIKQPAIARLERHSRSPRVSTLIKLLYPMGYTLRVVPLNKDKEKVNKKQ